MQYVIAIVLLIHGFAHLVGFVVPWRMAKLEEAPYTTHLEGGVPPAAPARQHRNETDVTLLVWTCVVKDPS